MKNSKEKTKILEINAHLSDEQVSLYADALKLGKEDELPQTIRSHVENCHECKKVVFNLYEIIKEQKEEYRGIHPYFDQPVEAQFPPEVGRSDWLKLSLRIAAILALMFVSSYVLYTQMSKTGPISVTQKNKRPTTPVDTNASGTPASEDIASEEPSEEDLYDPRELYAANFTESVNLEDLVEGAYRSINLTVESPENGAEVGETIIFSWQGQIGQPLELKILNNREDVLHSFTVTENSFEFENSLQPGLYYWKLETEDDLLHVGKFFVME